MAVELSSGRIVSVSAPNAGDNLVGDHASGATELTVRDACEFFDDGGTLLLAGDTLAYTGINAEDEQPTIVSLTAPTTNAYDDGTRVEVLPLTPKVTAQVVREGQGASEEARLWHTVAAMLPVGIRDPDEQEWCLLMSDREGDGWMVVDVKGKAPLVNPEAIPSGGGGGGTDGGNDDDTFVLPTLSEFVPDGPPEFYVDLSTGRVYTEDEAYDSLPDPYLLYCEFAAGSTTMDTVKQSHDYSHTLYPAWSVPLLGQDEKATVDSATVSGMSGSGLDSAVTAAGVQFGYMYEDPDVRLYTMINHFLLQASWVGGVVYDDRTWYEVNGNGDFAMPSSSDTETFPIGADLHTRGLIVARPMWWGSGGIYTVVNTAATLTGVRMEQG